MRGWVRATVIAVGALALAWSAPAAESRLLPPLGLPIPPVGATPTAIGTLDRRHPVLTFSGAVDNPTPFPLVNAPAPIVCQLTCEEFTFVAASTKPFLVSVKDTAGSQNNGWDLFVYDPDGALVGAANGVGANGQAIAVTTPARGEYRIFVTFTYSYDPAAAYLGEVRMMAASSWSTGATNCGRTVGGVSGCFRLPVLYAEPASDLHVDGLPPAASTPLGFPFPFAIPTSNSCYVDETIQLGATRCLRFTSNVKNVGAGLLDLRLTFNGVECHAEQVVHGSREVTAARPAGPCEFHPAHAHFHYKDFVGFSLHVLGPNGAIGQQVGSGLKESFCLADDDYFGYGKPSPNGPRTYAGQPDCSMPASVDGGALLLEEGLTPGWGDVYTWDTPGQVIDISEVRAGRYALVERTNPTSTILVAGAQQLCSVTELTLTKDAVTATRTRAPAAC